MKRAVRIYRKNSEKYAHTFVSFNSQHMVSEFPSHNLLHQATRLDRMTEFVGAKSDNVATTGGASKKGGKGKISKGMNSSELINSIEDAQVDELYEMDDWGKFILFCLSR